MEAICEGEFIMIEFETVKNVIVATLGCDAEAVKPEATLKDLGADSLAAVELMMAMEEATGVTISDEDMASLQTVGSIMDYVAAHQG